MDVPSPSFPLSSLFSFEMRSRVKYVSVKNVNPYQNHKKLFKYFWGLVLGKTIGQMKDYKYLDKRWHRYQVNSLMIIHPSACLFTQPINIYWVFFCASVKSKTLGKIWLYNSRENKHGFCIQGKTSRGDWHYTNETLFLNVSIIQQ